MENLSSIGSYFKEVDENKILSAQEELVLAKLKDQGDKKAREKLIKSNLRLVIYVAKNFQNQGCDIEDLIQEGNIGLMEGVDRYDWKKGYKLSTYACWWIRQKIDRYISNHGKNVRTPVHVLTMAAKLKKILENYRVEFGCEPTIDELMNILSCTEDMAKSAYQSVTTGQDLSIDTALKPASSPVSLMSKIKDNSNNPLDIILSNEIYDILRKALSDLSERDEKIIRLRFGISENLNDHVNFPITNIEMNQLFSRIETSPEEILNILMEKN